MDAGAPHTRWGWQRQDVRLTVCLAEWSLSPDYSRLSSRTIHQTGRKLLCWTSEMAPWVKALAAKPEVLSLIPRTHFQKLPSDLHM